MTSAQVGRYASGVAIPRLQEPDDRGTRAMMCILDDQLGPVRARNGSPRSWAGSPDTVCGFAYGTTNVTHSATQAGLSCPSTSMVKPTVSHAPACADLQSRMLAVARTRDPAMTGVGGSECVAAG